MKQIKFFPVAFILSLFFFSCTKEQPVATNDVIEKANNSEQAVIAGQPNCTEAIKGNLRLKVVVDTDKSTSTSTSVKINSKTEQLYPSGGYILVYDLTRSSNNIRLEYKQVNTSCGNPAAAAFLPATSAPQLNSLAAGSYPIEIIVKGSVNKGTLNIPASPGSPTLVMQSTNGIVIE
ncbi:MAG TPA: hypothetical protein VF622_06315 [Segetibacter sp.]|jgi:hypothetical protein